MKLNATQKKALKVASAEGFTFVGDSFAKTYAAARRALKSLVKADLMSAHTDADGRTAYEITANGREVLEYGDAAFEWIYA